MITCWASAVPPATGRARVAAGGTAAAELLGGNEEARGACELGCVLVALGRGLTLGVGLVGMAVGTGGG